MVQLSMEIGSCSELQLGASSGALGDPLWWASWGPVGHAVMASARLSPGEPLPLLPAQPASLPSQMLSHQPGCTSMGSPRSPADFSEVCSTTGGSGGRAGARAFLPPTCPCYKGSWSRVGRGPEGTGGLLFACWTKPSMSAWQSPHLSRLTCSSCRMPGTPAT